MKMADIGAQSRHVNVAPIISSEKASFVRRQLVSTLLGGVRTTPGVTIKAYVAQAIVWLLPAITVLAIANSSPASPSQPSEWYLLVAGTSGAVFCCMLELVRWTVGRRAVADGPQPRRTAWFTDCDDVDFSMLLNPATCRALLPPKRSWLHLALSITLSVVLFVVAVGAVKFDDLNSRGSQPSAAGVVVSVLCSLSLASTHFGLVGTPAVEVTTHGYRDSFSFSGLLADFSRPFTLLLVLGPLLFAPPQPIRAVLRVVAASLPALWVIGVVPQLDTLLMWVLEQLEVHVFGGSPIPKDSRLVAAVLASSGAAIATFAATVLSWQSTDSRVVAVSAAVVGLPLAGILAALPPSLPASHDRKSWGRLAAGLVSAELQALVGLGAGIALLWSVGTTELSMSFGDAPTGASRLVISTRAIRLGVEQLAVALSFIGLYFVSARHLRADIGATGCLSNGRTYRAHRERLLWGPHAGVARGVPAADHAAVIGDGDDHACFDSLSAVAAGKVAKAVVRLYLIVEVPLRILLLAYTVAVGAATAFPHKMGSLGNLQTFAEVVALSRAWRVVVAMPERAAVDTWLVGLVDLALAASGADVLFLEWSLGVRLFVVSIARGRFLLFCKYLHYAVHLSKVTAQVPKLRHPVVTKILLADACLFPLVIVILMAAAILEAPLIALFSLPVFAIGYPRPQHGHPELSADNKPLMKGAEGLFYNILSPSLLRGLAPRWRCGALSSRPGSMFLCRSHERLACVVRVLSAGYGWVSVEVRGLEMQEPTSCHHVEAGKIDDAFSEVLLGTVAASARPFGQGVGGGGATLEQGVGDGDGSSAVRAQQQQRRQQQQGSATTALQGNLRTFALNPVCEVTAVCYEQTQLSLRGIIDNPETLRQMHRLFLKTLVWVLAGEFRQRGDVVPENWLSCPLRSRDVQTVLNLLKTTTWPRQVADKLGLSGRETESRPGTRPGAPVSAAWVDISGTGTAAPEAMADADPMPPPGTPPSPMKIRNGRGASPQPGPGCSQPELLSSLESHARDLTTKASRGEQVKTTEDKLDALMDMVMDMAPVSKRGDLYGNGEAGDAHMSHGRGGLPAPTALGFQQAEKLSAPRHLAPLEVTGRHSLQKKSPDRMIFPTSASESGMAHAWQAPQLSSIEAPAELDALAKLVIEAYVAVNVAPACGQIPEALGAAHVFRFFAGQLEQGVQAAELRWLERCPELLELALRAFRYAVKVTVDCVAMSEDASALEYAELEVALQELERTWHLGEEDGVAWQGSMERRAPNLMALRKKSGTSDVHAVRLCLREDGVRVGELRPEVVHSIWASGLLELRYCSNDDDERYSIQAHPTLLRNMIVQSAEYPIFVSPPTTVWL